MGGAALKSLLSVLGLGSMVGGLATAANSSGGYNSLANSTENNTWFGNLAEFFDDLFAPNNRNGAETYSTASTCAEVSGIASICRALAPEREDSNDSNIPD